MKPDESAWLTLEDILEQAAQLDLGLSERTFRYYSVLGILPRPVKRTGDARVHCYPPEIIQRLQEIRSLQTQGFSLKQIKEQLQAPAASPVRRDASPLLQAVTSGRPQQAASRFLARAAAGEAALPAAALAYLGELFAMVGDSEESLRQAVSGLKPPDWDRLLRSLRQWAELQRPAGGLPLVRRLHEQAAGFFAGQPAPGGQQARAFEKRLHQLQSQVTGPQPGQDWLKRALDQLAAAVGALAGAFEAEDRAAALSALAKIERAEIVVEDLRLWLESHRRLQEAWD